MIQAKGNREVTERDNMETQVLEGQIIIFLLANSVVKLSLGNQNEH